MLQRLVQRTRVPEGEDFPFVLAPRPPDRLALAQVDRELDIHRDLDPRTDDLPVALRRVAIAKEEQGPRLEYRQVDRDALAEAPVVHIPAMLGRGEGRNRLSALRRHAKAPQHRIHRQLQPLKPRHRLHRRGGPVLEIDRPVEHRRLRHLPHEVRIDHVWRQVIPGPARIPVRANPVKANHERISRLRALDREGPRLRIRPPANRLQRRIHSPGINGRRRNRVLRRDPQHRLMRPECRVIPLRLESVLRHLPDPPDSISQNAARIVSGTSRKVRARPRSRPRHRDQVPRIEQAPSHHIHPSRLP